MPPLSLQSELFTRGVDDIITRDEIGALLASGRQLRIKHGIDATAPALHIGHAASLWKLRALQERGHKAVMIIGEFTTRIGDPTGKSATRPVLPPDAIRKNVAAIKKQIERILLTDPDVYEVHKNSEWFGRMKTAAFLDLLTMVTHARLIERDMFQERMRHGKEISAAEMLYPVLQGYDSVMVESDMTIIGSDQLFNEHMGRLFQERFSQHPQVIVSLRILPGFGGGEKMSKTLGNYIGLGDTPKDKFGKAMRVLDELIIPYLEAYTDMPLSEIKRIEQELTAGSNPRDAKLVLAEALVRRYHGEGVAQKERRAFVRQFSQRGLPEDVPEHPVGSRNPIDILLALEFASSRSDARRLIEQGAVEFEGKTVDKSVQELGGAGGVLKVGKRRIAKITFRRPLRGFKISL